MSQEVIRRWHLERIAFVYLRQSSPTQVRRNVEGKKRQERMRQHVKDLGWPNHLICVLGADTGNSGSSLRGREDYQRMLKAVLAERAGIIAASELSRLVRDNQDWNELVRVCRYKGVLFADEHRIYDPANSQDRVVLGIQGAFNEYELAILTERMQEARAQKAARGELYESFPPGYICRHGSLYEKHPDERVQRAVEKVFTEFENAPSGLRLFRRLLGEGFQLPVVPHGKDWRDLEWITPSYQQLMDMLHNPAYAGIYVRGRYKTFTTLDENGHAQKKRRRVPREEWEVFLEDHHEPYISKVTWERNMEKIASNAQHPMTKRSPQNGNGLMVGLLRCRRCGHKLHATYSNGRVSYVCRGGDSQRNARGKSCFCFRATRVEERLADLILEAINPAAIAAAKQAAEQLAIDHEKQRQLIVDRLEASREIEARAAREYKKTDATYTTVRQRLAEEWEEALIAVNTQIEELKRFDDHLPKMPTPAQERELNQLGKDVRRIWHHPKASMILKKQIVRTMIKEIVVDLEKPQNDIVMAIHWAGGHHTVLREPTHWKRRRGNREDLKRVVHTLRKVLDDETLAKVLNREKLHTHQSMPWTGQRVAEFREQHRIPAFSVDEKEERGWLTQVEAATYLQISPMSMSRLVQVGIIPAQQPGSGLPSVIKQKDLALKRVQIAVRQVKTSGHRPLPADPNQLNLFDTWDL